MKEKSIFATVLLTLFMPYSVASAVEFVLQYDEFAGMEIQANLMAGLDGLYAPEFIDPDVITPVAIPLEGIGSDGNAGTLLTAHFSAFGNNGTTPAPVLTHNSGLGVSNFYGSAVNAGDTIEITFDQTVNILSYSIAFTTNATEMFYKVGDLPQVELIVPALVDPQLIEIPDTTLPAGAKFTVGNITGNQFMLSHTVFEFGSSIPEPEGDLNLDGFVDAADAGVMFGNWGPTTLGYFDGNLNGDAYIDAADAGIMFGSWTGDTGPHAVSTPEPSTLMLVGLAGVLLGSRRRRA